MYINNSEITDLTGLELFTGLEELTIYGLDQVDYSKVKFPTSLVRLEISYCGLTTIPDVSKLTNLESLELNGNKIPASEFVKTNTKLAPFCTNYTAEYSSESLGYWMEAQADSQLLDTPEITMADTYYKTETGYPYYMEMKGADQRHDFKLSVYESGTETLLATADGTDYGRRITFTINSLGFTEDCSKKLHLVVKDLTDGTTLLDKEQTVAFKEQTSSEATQGKIYLPVSFNRYYMWDILTTYDKWYAWDQNGDRSENNGTFVDAAGNEFDVYVYVHRNYVTPEAYDDFYTIPTAMRTYNYELNVEFMYNSDGYSVSPGAATVHFKDADGGILFSETDLFEVVDAPIIKEVSLDTDNFDNQGEYLQVRLEGSSLGASFPEMTLKDASGNTVYDEVETFYLEGPVYRFHLKEAYRNLTTYSYTFKGENIYDGTNGTLTVDRVNGYMYGAFENTEKGGVQAFASSKMKDGETVELEIKVEGSEYKTLTGTVRGGEVFFDLSQEGLDDVDWWAYLRDGNHSMYVNWGTIINSENAWFSTRYTQGVRYTSQVTAPAGSTVEIRDAQSGKLLKSTTIPESGKLLLSDISDGLTASTLYLMTVWNSDASEYTAAVGMLNITAGTKDLTFTLTDPNGDTVSPLSTSANSYRMDYTSALKGKKLTLAVKPVGNISAALTAASSDTSVATVKVSGQNVILTVKGDGITKLTIQAKDTKYSETVILDLRNYAPRMNAASVSMNKVLDTTAVLELLAAYGTDIEKVTINEAALTAKEIKADYIDCFDVKVGETGDLAITLDESAKTLKNGSYRLPVTVTVVENGDLAGSDTDVERSFDFAVTVKLTSSKPKITAKQTEKVNLFYTDTKAVYTLTSSAGFIQNASLYTEEGAASYFTSSYDPTTGTLTLTPKADNDGRTIYDLTSKELSKALKVKVNVEVGEVGTVLTQSLTIGKSTTKPSITLDSTSGKVYKFTETVNGEKITHYTGTVLTFKVQEKVNKTTKVDLDPSATTVKLTGHSVTKKGETIQNFSPVSDGMGDDLLLEDGSFELEAIDGTYTIYFVGNAAATATMSVQQSNWVSPLKVTYKAAVTTSKITGKLSATKLNLNKFFEGDQKTLALTTNLPYKSFSIDTENLTVKAPKKAVYDGGLEIAESEDGKGITFSLNEDAKEDLAIGTYTITIPLTFTFEDGENFTPKALSVKVTVLDDYSLIKDVTWKTTGKINVVDREETCIIATPNITKLNATLVDVDVVKVEGEPIDKLDVTVVDGKLQIKLKKGESISTKDMIVVRPTLTVKTESGFTHIIGAKEINVKFTQTNPKLTLGAKSLTMYKSVEKTQTQEVTYTLKGAASTKVASVTSATAGFEAELLENGNIQMKLTNEFLSAKTYTVKLNVTFEGHATNQKPVSTSIKVVLKK